MNEEELVDKLISLTDRIIQDIADFFGFMENNKTHGIRWSKALLDEAEKEHQFWINMDPED